MGVHGKKNWEQRWKNQNDKEKENQLETNATEINRKLRKMNKVGLSRG